MNEENLTPHTTHGEVIDLKNVWGWKQVANEPHEFWQRDFAAGTVGAMIVWWNGIYGGWQIEEVEMLEEVARTLNDKKLAAGYVVLIDDKGEVCAAADVLRVIENCKNAKLSCSYFWINKEFMPSQSQQLTFQVRRCLSECGRTSSPAYLRRAGSPSTIACPLQ